ncbi:MAG: xanthine dehydrogenase family protein molybdopterin-binding subunit [Deltaproteobacteria bacterium]|nr:MAG: xanthine dehydrogenase family protein molybdopterin-binding subunit [Deltaproteobacteria bacterium]
MSWLDSRRPRYDAADKVTGKLLYPSDRTMDGALWVEVVRAAHPHALIRNIDTSRAEAAAGVVRVLTAKDVPGLNAFGIQVQDQPVLCHDRVRYQGDAVALVGAESRRAAREAARLVEIDYQVLEPLTDPERAMAADAPALHPGGNILHQGHFSKGDIEEGFGKSAVIVEDVYQVPMIDHAFLETEAGLSYYDGEVLVVESCGQYVFRDQTQIARSLGLPLDKVRVTAPFVGGAFGGKDEITVQIHLALMTYHTKRPARMVATRAESIVSHTKRHAARMYYKTGASRSGKLLAVQARFVSDTGAYASLGGPVLNLMMEHAAGPYLVPHFQVDAYAVYTNNGFAGAFRGFGCTQACLAMESQMERLARALRIDPLRFRQMNVLHQGDLAALGYPMKLEVGAEATIRSARRSKLWRNRRALRQPPASYGPSRRRYIRRGVGAASQMQGLGLGIGIPDYAEVEIELAPGPRATIKAGTTEIGQGAYHAYILEAAERLGLEPGQIRVVGADTGRTPDSGTTTASRTTYAVGNAILLAAGRLEQELGRRAARRLGWPAGAGKLRDGGFTGSGGWVALDELLAGQRVSARATFHVPVQDVEMGDGLPHLLYSYGTHVALVEVNTLTGEIRVVRLEAHLDGGQVISRTGFEGQSEGGIAQGIGYALFEEVRLDRGRFVDTNFDKYVLPTSLDVPVDMRTVPVMVRDSTGPFGAKGISETCMVGPTPAILNAIEDAIGVRFTRLPVRAEDVLQALREKEKKDEG